MMHHDGSEIGHSGCEGETRKKAHNQRQVIIPDTGNPNANAAG